MNSKEIDYLMVLSESGVVTHEDNKAQVNNVLEWLNTPVGSIYGKPEWGHELIQFKHEPTGSSVTAQNIEFSVVDKIVKDMPDIRLHSIYCEAGTDESDLYFIRIGLSDGVASSTLNLV